MIQNLDSPILPWVRSLHLRPLSHTVCKEYRKRLWEKSATHMCGVTSGSSLDLWVSSPEMGHWLPEWEEVSSWVKCCQTRIVTIWPPLEIYARLLALVAST